MDLSRSIRSDDYESHDNFSYVDDWIEGHDDDWFYDMAPILNVTCIVVYSLVFVFGTLGNGLVVWATGFKLKRTANTVWFLSLAAADLLYIALLPLAVTWKAVDHHWPLGKFMCKLFNSGMMLSMFASIYVLAAMSVDRCVSVVWAQNRRHNGARKAFYASAGVWALSLVLCCPDIVLSDTLPCPHDDDNRTDHVRCGATYVEPEDGDDTPELAMAVYNFLLGYGVPLVIIAACYAVVITHRFRSGSLSGHSSQGRPFRVTSAVVASFFLCFLCYQVMEIKYAVSPNKMELTLHWLWVSISLCLEALYRCLKPLLYGLIGQDFKKKHSILKVLERAFTEEESPSNPSTNLPLSEAEKVPE